MSTTQDASEERGGHREPAFRLSVRNIGAAFGALAALVAVITGAAAVLFQVAPGLRPRDPPVRKAAEVIEVLVDENVTFGQYAVRFDEVAPIERQLKESNSDAYASVRPVIFGLRGMIVYVQIRSQGLNHPLRAPEAHLYAVDGSRRLAGQQRSRIVERQSECRPRASDDQCVAAIFKPCDARADRVFVRVELRDDQKRLMDLHTTKPVICHAY